MRISKMTDYALVVLSHLATDEGSSQSARRIADVSCLPSPTVVRVLKQLSRAGLVQAARGVHGGYSLAKKPAEVSLAEVLSVFEGPVAVTECASKSSGCFLENRCPTKSNWNRLNQVIHQSLQSVSLESFFGRELPKRSLGATPVLERREA
jgi:FeS assembly SUF system regulator